MHIDNGDVEGLDVVGCFVALSILSSSLQVGSVVDSREGLWVESGGGISHHTRCCTPGKSVELISSTFPLPNTKQLPNTRQLIVPKRQPLNS